MLSSFFTGAWSRYSDIVTRRPSNVLLTLVYLCCTLQAIFDRQGGKRVTRYGWVRYDAENWCPTPPFPPITPVAGTSLNTRPRAGVPLSSRLSRGAPESRLLEDHPQRHRLRIGTTQAPDPRWQYPRLILGRQLPGFRGGRSRGELFELGG